MKARSGSKIYKGIEIPINAEIKIYKGRECYLCGSSLETRTIRFVDTGEFFKYKV